METIFARRSVRKYGAEAVSEADVRVLLEAAMAAPSANNSKPWHFVVVAERQKLDSLAAGHPHAKMLHQAPLTVAVCGKPADSDFWVQDCSAATENLLLAATAAGLGSVWVGVHPREQLVAFVRQELGMPSDVVPFCLIAVGHPAEEKEPRTQYDEGRVHRETW
ncbi:MAG: nitroreductase family protein [Anaerolineales bacterium]|nr:MAG: nitroreductase family protein [Anaerolineales bacterium]